MASNEKDCFSVVLLRRASAAAFLSVVSLIDIALRLRDRLQKKKQSPVHDRRLLLGFGLRFGVPPNRHLKQRRLFQIDGHRLDVTRKRTLANPVNLASENGGTAVPPHIGALVNRE